MVIKGILSFLLAGLNTEFYCCSLPFPSPPCIQTAFYAEPYLYSSLVDNLLRRK